MPSAGSTVLKATTEFHPGAKKANNEAGRLDQSAKQGGTAEVDACRFRPYKEINLYGAK